MKLKDLTNLTKNESNSQFSLNIRAKQLKKFGISHKDLLELNLPKNFKIIKSKRKVK